MRLHPLTVVRDAIRYAFGAVFTAFVVTAQGDVLGGVNSAVVVGGVALVLAGGAALARYFAFDYELGEETLVITSGVVSRKHREIPLHRVQTVDMNQSAVGRVVGVASLRIETAGGGETEATLSLVSSEEARRIKREVGRRRAARDEPAGEESDETTATATGQSPTEPFDDAGEILFSLTDGELAALSAITVRQVAVVGVLVGLPFGQDVLRVLLRRLLDAVGVQQPQTVGDLLTAQVLWAVVLLGAGVLFVTWLASAVVTFLSYYGFTLRRLDGQLTYERGLLRRFEGSIPAEKIQTVSVTETVAMRLLGYAAVAVETAGYAPGSDATERSPSAVPLARRRRALALVEHVEGFDVDVAAVSFERPPKRLRRRYAVRYALVVLAVTALAYAGTTLASSAFDVPSLPWFLPLVGLPLTPVAGHYHWKHLGYHVGEDHLLTRYGFWRRRIRVVPYYRLQTVIETRTVFQRRWDVATVTADTASSSNVFSGGARAVDVASPDAVDLHETLRERLRVAVASRRGDGTEKVRTTDRGDGSGPSGTAGPAG